MRVLITRHVFEEALEILRPLAELDYHDDHDGLSEAQLCERVQNVDAMICQLTDTISRDVIAAGSKLGILANVAVGYDNIDLDAAQERGILVTNTPDVLTESTADLTWALMLAAARRLTEAERFLRRGQWQQWEIDLLCGRDIHHQTLGIIGMGRIGQAVARRAQGFGMPIRYHSRSALDQDLEQQLGARRVHLSDLLSEADVVTLHIPLIDETRHLIDTKALAHMKSSAILINTARGPIVDEAALARALRDGTIAAAGLDVFEDEPVVLPGLLELDNLVLLPHIGSASIRTRTEMCCMAAENVAAYLRGERPPHLVTPPQ